VLVCAGCIEDFVTIGIVMTHKSNDFISELQTYRYGRLEQDLDDIFKQFPLLASCKDKSDPMNSLKNLVKSVERYFAEQTSDSSGDPFDALRVIRDFIFSQTEAASIAADDNHIAKLFVEWTGITPDVYKGAMKKSTGVSDSVEQLLGLWVQATGKLDARFPTAFVHIIIMRSFSHGYSLVNNQGKSDV
jgi:hypothetical protein